MSIVSHKPTSVSTFRRSTEDRTRFAFSYALTTAASNEKRRGDSLRSRVYLFSYDNFYRPNVLVDRDTVYPSCPCKWIAGIAASPVAWSASTAWPRSWAAAPRSRSQSAKLFADGYDKAVISSANINTYQTYTNVLEGRMIQLPRRAASLPLIIHRRQYLKTRSSLKLFPNSAKTYARLCQIHISNEAYKRFIYRILQTLLRRYVSGKCRHLKTVQRLRGLHLTLYLAIV